METQYFKAGSYCQEFSARTVHQRRRTGRVLRCELDSRPEHHTSPPAKPFPWAAIVTFKVGALGNPPLKYAWRLNGTNINNATNVTLTIPNVQLTNAGIYSVVVTDFRRHRRQ